MHTLVNLAKALNRPAVYLQGLQKRFALPVLLKNAAYSDAYLLFLQTIIRLRTLNVTEEAILNLWHTEKKLLQLLYTDSTGSPTWFLNSCGSKSHSNHRLLLSDNMRKLNMMIFVTLFMSALVFVEAGRAQPDAKSSDDSTMLLSGSDWFIHSGAQDLSQAEAKGAGWFPATVPGNVQADLEAAHELNPLWYGAGDPRMAETPQKDWWYRKDFKTPDAFVGKRLKLVFDGVDHECEVWLNGKKLGTHAGMYKRFSYDVADVVKPGEVNRLAVKVARIPEDLVAAVSSADERGGKNVGKAITAVRQKLKDLKSPANEAWDWSVAVYTIGIWKDVRLEATGPAKIEWVRVRTDLTNNYQKVTVRVDLEVDSLADLNARVSLKAVHQNSKTAKTTDFVLKKGMNQIDVKLPLDQPALWWPAGQGDQPLYELTSEIKAAGSGEILDSRKTKFGVREIRWGQVPGAAVNFINPLKLVVNGRPMRQMGSNILPPDALFGRIDPRGLRLMELARAGGINCLRIWGGGVIFSEKVYDRADELGIMLLAEFPLANYWPETNDVFMANFKDSIVSIVKQTRNHPSIVEWTGGNEMPWQNGTTNIALQLLEKIMREDDGRMFRATEPAQGSGMHGSYTYVYHNEPAGYLSWLGVSDKENLYHRYNTSSEMRLSEFGCNSPANLEVWHREIPPSSQWPLTNMNDAVLIRKNVFYGAQLEQNWLHKEIIESLFGPVDGLDQLVSAGQFIGAEGLRYAMDALRRKGKALGGGFMSWNYNEPVPNGAGSYMIDYDGRPLMNYDFVKQALVPVSLALKYDSLTYSNAAGVKAELCLASDAPNACEGLRWKWLARDRRGLVFGKGEGTAAIEPQEVKSLASLVLKPPAETVYGPVFVEMQLSDSSGKLLAERLHIFGTKESKKPLAGLLKNGGLDVDDSKAGNTSDVVRQIKRTALKVSASASRIEGDRETLDLVVKNTGKMTALFCVPHPLIEYRTDLFIDNNHCFIPPGETRTITIRSACKPKGGLTLAQTGWRLSTWNADDQVIEPSDDVTLALGRRDAITREYLGYGDITKIGHADKVTLKGRRPDASKLPLLQGKGVTRFEFKVDSKQAKQGALLRIHSADQSKETGAEVTVSVNGNAYKQTLSKGLEIQNIDPAHLSFPATLVFEIPGKVLKSGNNIMEIRVMNNGWFTWDAMDMIIPLLLREF